MAREDTHSLAIGYLLWIFGFLGAHRFYYGRPVSGTIYFFTFGLFFIGWIVDLFLMPKLEHDADQVYVPGHLNYTVTWVLLTFLGIFGIHRFYMGKWGTGLLYLFTCGFFLVGIIYDYWTLNDQIAREHSKDYDFAAYR
ncbi:MAG: TM2 domain-containing protein [Pseudomonadota bacterium]